MTHSNTHTKTHHESAQQRNSEHGFVQKPWFTHRFVRILVIILLAGICLSVLNIAYHRGNANAWYYQVEYAINDWSEAGAIASLADYQDTLAIMKKVVALDPNHPHYAHMMGRVLHWGVNMDFEPRMTLIEVKQWYLKATERRPLWPDPWADLAILNNYLSGYDEETQFYLAQALVAGPFDDLVKQAEAQVLNNR